MSKYSETLVNEARDLLEECVNPPLAKYTLEERNELISSNKTLKWIVDHAKELPLENWDKSLIVEMLTTPKTVKEHKPCGFYSYEANIEKEPTLIRMHKNKFYDMYGNKVEVSDV